MKGMVFLFYFNVLSLCKPFTASDAVREALNAYKEGKVHETHSIFKENSSNFPDSSSFFAEYFKFLIEQGKYSEIIEIYNNKIPGEKAKLLFQKAKECQKIIDSNDNSKIASLISESKDSIQVLLAVVKQTLTLKKNPAQALNYVNHALRLANEEESLPFLVNKCAIQFALGDITSGLNTLYTLKDKDSKYFDYYQRYNSTNNAFSRIKESNELPETRIKSLIAIYNKVLTFKEIDFIFIPSIFESLYSSILENIVEIGVQSRSQDTHSYSFRLSRADPSQKNISNHIRALIYAGKFETAETLLLEHKSLFNPNHIVYLNKLLEEYASERNKRKEQKQPEPTNRIPPGSRAGKDFLGYYKTLDVKKDATDAQLKKAHRVRSRKISKEHAKLDISKYPKNQSPKDIALRELNIAYQTLTDKQKRQAYDMGHDPSEVPQQPSKKRNSGSNQGQYDDRQMQEIFKELFGGGRSSSNFFDSSSFFGNSGGFSGGSRGSRQFIFIN